EETAAKYYTELGYTIRERNWQAGHREIDLIVENDQRLIFVEVKGGRDDFMGHPAHRVDERKQRLLIEAAQAYLAAHDPGARDVQFDVLIVLRTENDTRIERLENAIQNE
ncbi:MAG TPA: YraN family protein, partial [candidate division Zixibacteria bacterium]|nr:YraN family protein [candidate division Zixibacteria bacterium]